jgi:ABC-type spermidine/putrescine transport system permease subunit II
VFAIGFGYFFLPLIGTGVFSLRARADQLSLDAYASVLGDSRFFSTFMFSLEIVERVFEKQQDCENTAKAKASDYAK